MFQKTTLKNGLRVLTSSMPGSFSTVICVLVKVGARYENEKNAGISHFLEHMFYKGSRKWPTTKDLAFIVEGNGGYFGGWTSKESTGFEIKIPKGKIKEGVEISLDMILYPQIEEQELEKEKGVITQEINRRYDSPQKYIWELIDKVTWAGHPLGQDTGGYKKTIQSFRSKDLKDFFEKFYIPQRMVISAAGDIEHQDFVKDVEGFFDKKFTEKKEKLEFLPLKEKQNKPNLKIDSRKTGQSHFILGVNSFGTNHPDKFVLNVIHSLLGIGWSSRLMLNIRSQKGLAYNINSNVNYLSDTGRLMITGGIKNEMMGSVVEEIIKELKRLKKEKVNDQELRQAKEKIKGRFLFGIESPEDQAEWYSHQELFNTKVLEPKEILVKIDKVTAEDIMRVAQQLFVASNLNFVLIGPFKKEDQEKFAGILKKID